MNFRRKLLIKLAGVPQSSYYYYVSKMNKAESDADVKKEIRSIYLFMMSMKVVTTIVILTAIK